MQTRALALWSLDYPCALAPRVAAVAARCEVFYFEHNSGIIIVAATGDYLTEYVGW